MSSWTLDVGSPCFTYSGFVVYDLNTYEDVTSHFGAFDEVNFMLPLLGNAGLSGQTIDYEFYVVISDEINGYLSERYVEIFSVDWSTACDTAVLDQISVSNIVVPYGGTQGTSISEPSDSVALSLLDPTICGVRAAHIFDVDTSTPFPAYVTVTVVSG